jgi:hypothetical protein
MARTYTRYGSSVTVRILYRHAKPGETMKVAASKNDMIRCRVLESIGWRDIKTGEVGMAETILPGFTVAGTGDSQVLSILEDAISPFSTGLVGVYSREAKHSKGTSWVDVGIFWTPDENLLRNDPEWRRAGSMKEVWQIMPRKYCLECMEELDGKPHDKKKCVVRSVMVR